MGANLRNGLKGERNVDIVISLEIYFTCWEERVGALTGDMKVIIYGCWSNDDCGISEV